MRAFLLVLMAGCVAPEDAAMQETAGVDAAPPPVQFSLGAGNFVAGEPAVLTFTGAPPNALVRFAYSFQGLGPGLCPPVLGGACLGIRNPASLMGLTTFASAQGAGSVTIPLPPSAGLRYVGVQAVVFGGPGGLSNPIGRLVGASGTRVDPTVDRDADGFTPAQGDCADFNNGIYPGAADAWGDGYDTNCDDADGVDVDGDGVAAGPDCDDGDALVFPGARDACNGVDDDCDGAIDANANGVTCDREEVFTVGVGARADVLFLIDNSCSMSEEQADLSVAAAPFLGALTTTDLHLGVVTTDMNNALEAGRLTQVGGRRYADGTTPNITTWLQTAISRGVNGHYEERGLDATYAALTNPILSAENLGFLRSDADLHVIFLSDEPDYSVNVDAASWLSWATGLKAAPWTVTAHALVGPAGGCAYADDGAAYRSVTASTGGLFQSICQAPYDAFMGDVADAIEAGGAPSLVFQLADLPAQGTVEVVVTSPGGTVMILGAGDWTFNPSTLELTITGVTPPAGSTVSITYDL